MKVIKKVIKHCNFKGNFEGNLKDKFKGNLGPLAGIHSALYWIKHNNPEIKWLVSIPSDTPFFPKNLIDKLFLKTQKNNNKIILAESNNKLHPVIGLWKYDLLDDLDNSDDSSIDEDEDSDSERIKDEIISINSLE